MLIINLFRGTNKGVIYSRVQVLEAFADLVRYYESLEEPTQNTEIAKTVLKEILSYDNSQNIELYQG